MTAQAPLDVPGAGCTTKRGLERERRRARARAREYRRVPVGSLSAASRGTGRGGVGRGARRRGRGGWRWRRHERVLRTPRGFQAAVYGPGQRDQDRGTSREREGARARESSRPRRARGSPCLTRTYYGARDTADQCVSFSSGACSPFAHTSRRPCS